MATWILTIGDSDVQLTTDENWTDLYDQVADNSPLEICEDLKPAPTQDKTTNLYPIPARALGLVYHPEVLEQYWQDLAFPLLDTFRQKFANGLATPTRIIILLTDQNKIFNHNQKQESDCPFWQDTITLQPILQRYLQQYFTAEPEFYSISVSPNPNGESPGGIDNWEEMVKQVDAVLKEAQSNQNPPLNQLAYVSHQASTPAISSAVQFLALSQFERVKFLVSNRFYGQDYQIQSTPALIESSRYWRGLQLQKAQRLILAGQPGAALEMLRELPEIDRTILEKLQLLVNQFNMKADPTTTDTSREFDPPQAAQRIRDALDIIEILLQNESYALAIAILAAAHETFLKAAILHLVSQMPNKLDIVNYQGHLIQLSLGELLVWDNRGLCLRSRQDLQKILHKKHPGAQVSDFSTFIHANRELSDLVRFVAPSNNSNWSRYLGNQKSWTLANIQYRYFAPNNQQLITWLWNFDQLQEFSPWKLMDWMGIYNRDREGDKRNQLMHNLRGVSKTDVNFYLQGNPKKKELQPGDDIIEIYHTYVKQPFCEVLHQVGLTPDPSIANRVKETLHKLAAKLN